MHSRLGLILGFVSPVVLLVLATAGQPAQALLG